MLRCQRSADPRRWRRWGGFPLWQPSGDGELTWPRNDMVVVRTSAGGVEPLMRLLGGLSAGLAAQFPVVLKMASNWPSACPPSWTAPERCRLRLPRIVSLSNTGGPMRPVPTSTFTCIGWRSDRARMARVPHNSASCSVANSPLQALVASTLEFLDMSVSQTTSGSPPVC